MLYRKSHPMTDEDKAKQKIRCDRYYEKHREQIIVRTKKYYKENLDKVRNRKLINAYGITLIEYESLLKKQKGVCAICKTKGVKIDNRTGLQMRLAVDHDHKTGKVRGLLCCKCNLLLGGLSEDSKLMIKIIKYIKENS